MIGFLEKENRDCSKEKAEKVIVESLLPKMWDLEQIKSFLENHLSGIMGASTEGQAIGMAMKVLKSEQAPVSGNDVKKAVEEILTRRS